MKPSQAAAALELYIGAGQPVILHGSPGGGKSAVVHQVAKKLGLPLIDMRLSQMDAVDLRGIPYRENGMTYWATNSQLPTNEKHHPARGILFLDEFTSANKSMQAPAYQIVLDHKIGDVPLLPGWHVVAAGNLMSDRAIVESMSTALKNRFAHIEFETDNDDWCKWAITQDVSLEVLGYLRFQPQDLNDFARALSAGKKGEKDAAKQTKIQDLMAFATPRSWMFVDRMLKKGVPADLEYEVYSGLVSEGVAAKFLGYLKHHRNIPNLDMLLMNPDKAEIPTEPAVLFALATGLAAKATEDNFDRVVQYLNRLQDIEYQVLTIKDAAMRNNALCHTSAFNDWTVKNSDVLV